MFEIMPKARKQSLIIVTLPDETLVYDSTRHQAMCLNRPVAAIWSYCDGEYRVSDLIPRLRKEVDDSIDEEIVELAVHQLNQRNLLEEPWSSSTTKTDVDVIRRRLMKVGMAAALLPLITVVTAPTAAQAATIGATGPTGPTGETGPIG